VRQRGNKVCYYWVELYQHNKRT